VGVELSADNRQMLYVPKGCAHGFQTLEDDCEVFYQISAEYHSPSARGLRHDDPGLAITWPLPVTVLSKDDRALPTLVLH
jgi:dTDP-4-dehydrorhamnose 3,5-epimerase